MNYKEFKDELYKKLDINEAKLYREAEKISKVYFMAKKKSIYVYALRNNIKALHKHLKDIEIEDIRNLNSEYESSLSKTTANEIPVKSIELDKKKKSPSIKKPKQVDVNDPILNPKKIKEANEMAELYPYLYILENSIREFIDSVLTKKYGSEWWKLEKLKDIKRKIEKNKGPEKKHTWHQKKGDRAIDYLEMDDLPKIIGKMHKDFKPNELPDHVWFEALVKEVYISRCVLAHMNPLNDTSALSLKVKYEQWQEHLKKIEHLI